MERRHHLCAVDVWLYVPGGDHRLVQPLRHRLALVEHARRQWGPLQIAILTLDDGKRVSFWQDANLRGGAYAFDRKLGLDQFREDFVLAQHAQDRPRADPRCSRRRCRNPGRFGRVTSARNMHLYQEIGAPISSLKKGNKGTRRRVQALVEDLIRSASSCRAESGRS